MAGLFPVQTGSLPLFQASFTLQAEPSRAEPGRASDYSHCKPSRPELKAVQRTFLKYEDVEKSAFVFING
jgi:hypothetical protein